MPTFEKILAPLLAPHYGLHCAVMADSDGEMIAQQGVYVSERPRAEEADATALFGAHQGVVLRPLLHLGTESLCGALQEVGIHCDKEDWFVFPVATEYYLAVAAPHGVCLGRVRAAIRECVQQLCTEVKAWPDQ